jgi:CelD/BcsL family acetyltransferase involved in cellulose biosynthesis
MNMQRYASISCEVLTGMEEIRAIASSWDELVARSRCNRAYSSSTWYLATQELVPDLQPLVFVAYRDHALAGVFPLWLEPGRRLARSGDHYIEHVDVIALDDDLEVVEGLVDFALQGNGSYDRLVLEPIRYDSNFVNGARGLGLGQEIDKCFLPDTFLPYAVLDLSYGYDEYMKTLSRKFRLNLHRLCHKAARDGFVIRELKRADMKPELLPEILLSLHLSRFGGRSNMKSSQSWLQSSFPPLFAQGRLRIFAMLDKERIVAIDSATVTRFGIYGFVGGFLREVQKYDPGKLLIHKAIQQICLDGLTEFDLGWWGQDYKAHWKPNMRVVGDIRLATRPGSCRRTHDAEYSRA